MNNPDQFKGSGVSEGRIEEPSKIHLAIRGFANGVRQFEDLVEMGVGEIDTLMPQLAEKHATAMASHELHMIEIEFLDEPDPQQRFFRFGSDHRHMVAPMLVDLEDLE